MRKSLFASFFEDLLEILFHFRQFFFQTRFLSGDIHDTGQGNENFCRTNHAGRHAFGLDQIHFDRQGFQIGQIQNVASAGFDGLFTLFIRYGN